MTPATAEPSQSGPQLGKDLIGLENLEASQIQAILDTAEPFKEISERAIKKPAWCPAVSSLRCVSPTRRLPRTKARSSVHAGRLRNGRMITAGA